MYVIVVVMCLCEQYNFYQRFLVFILAGNHIKLIGRVKNNVIRLDNGLDSFILNTALRTIDGSIYGYCLCYLSINTQIHYTISGNYLNITAILHIFEIFFHSRAMHRIKSRDDLIGMELPKLVEHDIVFVTGELVYSRVSNGDKFLSTPNVFANRILRLRNQTQIPDMKQLQKGIL